MLLLYSFLMTVAEPFLQALLRRRLRAGKEDPARVSERLGIPALPRPTGKLVWLHAASVGEAQSILSLTDALLARTPASVLITTGTVNSAKLLAQRLPPRALHQYYPLDRPAWAARFLDHWRPDAAIWTESEIWPAMFAAIRRRKIPAALVNARLSERSYESWRLVRPVIRRLLGTFSLILCQTDSDTGHFAALGAEGARTSGNLKYSAAPLPAPDGDLRALREAIGTRPVWLYASTHAGEEEMAARLHAALRRKLPGLLTIIVPRHPKRAAAIVAALAPAKLNIRARTDAKIPPVGTDDIYLADTIGELGLFYRLAPVACVGRSFSDDGGGGHNPLEPAQLGCAVLHGPAVQNLAAIYAEMDAADAAIKLRDEADFARTLERLLGDPAALHAQQARGTAFVAAQAAVLGKVLAELTPLLATGGL